MAISRRFIVGKTIIIYSIQMENLIKSINDTADRLLGIDDDWTVQYIQDHLEWLIDNPDEISDGYDKSVFKDEYVDAIMDRVAILKSYI
jgi:hypothetical protein